MQQCCEAQFCPASCPCETEVLFSSLVDISGSVGVRLRGREPEGGCGMAEARPVGIQTCWVNVKGRERELIRSRSPWMYPKSLHISVAQECRTPVWCMSPIRRWCENRGWPLIGTRRPPWFHGCGPDISSYFCIRRGDSFPDGRIYMHTFSFPNSQLILTDRWAKRGEVLVGSLA